MTLNRQSRNEANRRRDNGRDLGPEAEGGRAGLQLPRLGSRLRAEEVILPGEDRLEFEAYLEGWFAEWGPVTETRCVLVDQGAVTGWRLKRCRKAETLRITRRMETADRKWEAAIDREIDGAADSIGVDCADKVAFLSGHRGGIDVLIEAWDELHRATETPGDWASFDDHHDRLCHLLGIGGTYVEGPYFDLTASSHCLVHHNEGTTPEGMEPGDASTAEFDRLRLRDFCFRKIRELAEAREQVPAFHPDRLPFIEAESLGARPEDAVGHRLEARLDRELKSTIRLLVKLAETGADLAGFEAPGRPSTTEPIAETDDSQEVATEDLDNPASVDAPSADLPTGPKPDPTGHPEPNRKARRRAAREARLIEKRDGSGR